MIGLFQKIPVLARSAFAAVNRGKAPGGTVFLSFDVEALLIRAPDNYIDRLIWGKTSGGEYGIRRLSGILRQYGLKGNFLVDLAACHIHGDDRVREIFDFLLGEGHEVHAHMHPEMLAESWKLERTGVKARRFDDFDRFLAVSLLAYAAKKYREFAGRDPFLFRSGSYLFNRHTIDAAKKAGFAALSNFGAKRHEGFLPPESPAYGMNPFLWDNGIAEMPVDVSSPEKLSPAEFLRRWRRAARHKESGAFNLVSHSWSLLKRDANDHFMEFVPEQEERFHGMCASLSGNARVMGYEEYLAENPPRAVVASSGLPAVPPLDIKRALRCRDCLAIMSPSVVTDNRCKNCGSLQIAPFDSRSYRKAMRERRKKRAAQTALAT